MERAEPSARRNMRRRCVKPSRRASRAARSATPGGPPSPSPDAHRASQRGRRATTAQRRANQRSRCGATMRHTPPASATTWSSGAKRGQHTRAASWAAPDGEQSSYRSPSSPPGCGSPRQVQTGGRMRPCASRGHSSPQKPRGVPEPLHPPLRCCKRDRRGGASACSGSASTSSGTSTAARRSPRRRL